MKNTVAKFTYDFAKVVGTPVLSQCSCSSNIAPLNVVFAALGSQLTAWIAAALDSHAFEVGFELPKMPPQGKMLAAAHKRNGI